MHDDIKQTPKDWPVTIPLHGDGEEDPQLPDILGKIFQ
jgi:hypothetical protein